MAALDTVTAVNDIIAALSASWNPDDWSRAYSTFNPDVYSVQLANFSDLAVPVLLEDTMSRLRLSLARLMGSVQTGLLLLMERRRALCFTHFYSLLTFII